jgi:steroid 5-alpha reductase family enzyme
MTESEKKRLLVLPIALALWAGLAVAGGQGSVRIGGVPLFVICVALAMAIQWIAFVPAFLAHTERFFDLTGSLTYIICTGVAVSFGPPLGPRSTVLATLVVVWAARLGSFLFLRITREGADRRFDEIRGSFVRFFVAWTLQGVWVSFTMGAALAVITSERPQSLGALGWAGLTLWIVGFGIEIVADAQKKRFRSRPENAGRFIRSGLWAWSRHPNYFGEIVLWFGVAMIATPALQGWQYVTLLSPVFVTLLLTRVSGVPLLEPRADAKWGGDPEYEAYKASTPVLVMRPPR